MFSALRTVCTGRVLDIGGGDFFSVVQKRGIPFSRWITLEPEIHRSKDRATRICGDGQVLPFVERSFDTILCVHVLEHVLDPLAALREASRVLRPGGAVILMYPQTAGIHMAPNHYYNFTPYFGREACSRFGLDIIEHRKLGGVFSTVASQMVYLLLKLASVPGYTTPEFKRSRSLLFYALLPIMLPASLLIFSVAMLLSLGDLAEEANNHLIVARKR